MNVVSTIKTSCVHLNILKPTSPWIFINLLFIVFIEMYLSEFAKKEPVVGLEPTIFPLRVGGMSVMLHRLCPNLAKLALPF